MSRSKLGRRDRLIKQARHDTYHVTEKHPDPTLCPECGALFTNGRWVWTGTEQVANQSVCPACRRIAERNPAGDVVIDGPFHAEHREEIVRLIDNVEKQETLQRPMERVIEVRSVPGGLVVTTTGIHIARRVGNAVARAYGGELRVDYLDDETRVRIVVSR